MYSYTAVKTIFCLVRS